MPLETNFVEGHPRIEEVRNQVAIKRGPVVYCIESPDLPKDADILDVYISGDTKFKVNHRKDFLGGISTIESEILIRSDKKQGMYRTIKMPNWESHKTTFIPYYAWSNRGKAEMTVFLPVIW